MQGESTNEQGSASPYSTGGGGTRLEHRLGALYLVRLLTGGTVSELAERAPGRVAFQQSPITGIDDLVLTAAAADGVTTVRLDVAVRRSPKFVKSDEKTSALVLALVREELAIERDSGSLTQRRLAVAVSGHPTHAREIAELSGLARGQSTAERFFDLVTTPGKFASRPRLMQLRDMVAAALLKIGDSDAGSAEHRCWSLLTRLWIIETDLEMGHEGHWTALIDDLKPVTPGHSQEGAVALRDRLDQLSAELARVSGAVDVATLRKRLHGEIISDAHLPPAGWTRLLRLNEEARSVVGRTLAGLGSAAALTLPRKSVRDGLSNALALPGDILVKGDSGVGKSAIVMDAIEPAVLGDNRQALAINLRHLPDTPLELLDMLISPVEELFSELTAPDCLLVIDGAEAAAERHGQMFFHVLRCARSAGLRVVAIAATEGSGAVTELMTSGANVPREYVVPGLDDGDIATAGVHLPALQRLIDNPRARELLRRPIVVELLSRAGDPGLPLTDSEALGHIWERLVRNGGRQDAGAPDARERVMLQLAADAVHKRDTDALLSRLDDAAVDDLRKSGVLLPASRMPWDRVPQFKHDLLRAYSVARYLLSERDPAKALEVVGAPRWTLPSARLASEILLSAPDEPSHPVPGRFALLQKGFDAIAAAGNGERWRDIPSEALLAVRDVDNLLKDAWSGFVDHDAVGLARLVRVLKGRHKAGVVLDTIIAEPVIARLLAEEVPRGLTNQVDALVSDWLRALVLSNTPEGHATRVALREAILQRCAEKERLADAKEAARQSGLAARNPEQVGADEERENAVPPKVPLGGRRKRRLHTTRHRAYLWISDAQIEHLALLGADLGADGEAALRQLAEDDPASLDHAVEAVFAGNSLAAYDPQLLIDLAAAYYIEEDEEEDEVGIGWSGDMFDDGIRDHRFSGGPLFSFTCGPFLAIFQSDYRRGVKFLNRMLDHAAQCRVRRSSNVYYGCPGAEDADPTHATLSIAEEPRDYVGDNHVWRWYRGTGVGPYPCISALQALEFVTEQYISAGIPPETLTAILLEDAQNLAMPAVALAVLVRHLESTGTAIDPFLVEPEVWEHEFARAAHEHSGLAAVLPDIKNPERRGWNLREVSMMLALQAEDDRVGQLKLLGQQLQAKAQAQVDDTSSPGAREHLAAVRTWAAALDRDAYELQRQGDQIFIQHAIDPEVENVLGDTNADLRRSSDATALTVRHAHVRDRGGRAPNLTAEALSADLVTARDLLENPPESWLGSSSSDGPAAVAASALELHLTGQVSVSQDDLAWSAAVLLRVAADIAEHPPTYDYLFSQGADRSAGHALPLLLLPEAAELRRTLGMNGPNDVNDLISLSGAIASRSENEARLAFARALDAVWAAPCNLEHLHGRCHHLIAIDLVTDSFLDSVFGPWDSEGQRRSIARLDPPDAASLDSMKGEEISAPRLTAPIRGTGSAAASTACCAEKARRMLQSLLAGHQRAMLAFEHGYHHSHSDSLVAARAALWQASDGRDDVLLSYVDRYLQNPRLLAEGLKAIAAAGEERVEAGAAAHRLWSRIMDRVLDYADNNPSLFSEPTWGAYAEADLIPEPSPDWHYLTIEMLAAPHRWRNLLTWSPQVERWLETITSTRMSIDHLVVAVRELDVTDQVTSGLRWVERIVVRSGNDCAKTYTLPEWLHERRPDLLNEDQVARWQRVVDLLVVAGDSRVADLAD